MPTNLIADVSILRGEDEIHSEETVLEIVDCDSKTGAVQVGVNGARGTRIYLRFDLGQLVGAAVQFLKPE